YHHGGERVVQKQTEQQGDKKRSARSDREQSEDKRDQRQRDRRWTRRGQRRLAPRPLILERLRLDRARAGPAIRLHRASLGSGRFLDSITWPACYAGQAQGDAR